MNIFSKFFSYKKEIYNILEAPYLSKYGFLVQKIIVANIVVNISCFMFLYFLPIIDKTILKYILFITNFLFLIELILRYVVIGINKKYQGIFGRLKYTLTLYAIVDILSILPLFITLGSHSLLALRLIRFLKLLRVKKFLKKFISFEAFATSGIFTQALVLLIASIIIIISFSFFYHSISKSALIFIDPPGIVELHKLSLISIGIVELILGLLIGGALISIITSYLENTIHKANLGLLPFKEKDHIVIIGENSKLDYVLSEIERYSLTNEIENEVVIILPQTENIENFRANLKKYKHIGITLISGDLLNYNTYIRANINHAKNIIFLTDDSGINNVKIVDLILNWDSFTNDKVSFIIESENIDFKKLEEVFHLLFNNRTTYFNLINKSKILQRILNRAIVNYKYFQILSELLTFDGYEFYLIDYRELGLDIDIEYSFLELSLMITSGILTGIFRNKKLILNPDSNFLINKDDKLLIVLENRYFLELNKDEEPKNIKIRLELPKLKEDKKIAVVGEYNDISISDISEFLTEQSIQNFIHIVKDNYMDYNLWQKIEKSNFDVIILNLEDEYEYLLTLYLRSKFNKEFLSKIVNIIIYPVFAKLLESKNYENIIISEKLIGEYITQLIFNPVISEVINEITSAYGNEFYILNKKDYPGLFEMEFTELKEALLKNKMIYIGAFKKDKFIFNHPKISDVNEIAVLCEGL